MTEEKTVNRYYSRGKLLLSGEYMVLSGAKALGVPLRSGQDLQVRAAVYGKELKWDSREQGKSWFKAKFTLDGARVLESTDDRVAEHLSEIMIAAGDLSKRKIPERARDVVTNLEFPRSYGWGSSSTLLANIAQWFGIDPLALHFKVSAGSGYDVALAMAEGPLIYQQQDGKAVFHSASISERITSKLYFVYLGKKQDTQKSILEYNKTQTTKEDVERISRITERMSETSDLREFQELIFEHEAVLSEILGKPGIQKVVFGDFEGAVKSMGAWGGDFVMACSADGEEQIMKYFSSRGYPVVYPYRKIVCHD